MITPERLAYIRKTIEDNETSDFTRHDFRDMLDEIDALREERDQWKANHDNQVDIKRAIICRPDLHMMDRERKVLVVALNIVSDERDTATKDLHAVRLAHSETFAAWQANEKRCAELLAALDELVALKHLKEIADMSYGKGNAGQMAIDEYQKRKPLAWEAAKRAIAASATPAEQKGGI